MRIKDVVSLRNEKTTDTSMPYIALENVVSWDAKFIDSDSETEGTNSIFKKGDVLFGKLRPYLAKGFCPSYDGICSTEFFVMKPNKECNSRYLLYFILSVAFVDYIKNQVAGVKMPRTKWTDFGGCRIIIPSLPEQQRIVDYLDEKLSAIDNRVENLEKQKDAYARLKKSIIHQAVTRGLNPNVRLKESGIEWIGQIPEHWDVKRIKDAFSINQATLPENTKGTYQFKYIDISNVSNEGYISLGEDVIFIEAPSRARRIIKKGDIVVSTVRTYLRAIALIVFDTADVIVSTGFAVLTPKNFAKSNYMFYTLRDYYVVDAICSLSTGVSYPAIAASRLASIDIITPPLSEQEAIANYLDEKCAKIDAAIENISKQIDASKRLKRALINEVITGLRAV